MSVTRGCGTRAEGAAYLEVRQSPNGVPLEHYLICPPIPVDPAALRIEPRGVYLIERPDGSGVTDAYDWIGSEHYPNVADAIEEGRRHGFSRRISRTTDFARLTEESRLILLHARAHIDNAADYRQAIHDQLRSERQGAPYARPVCPKDDGRHIALEHDGKPNPQMCQALYHDDITDAEPVYDPAVPYRTVERTVGDTTYRARRRPDDVTPRYQVAIFAALPITTIAVIRAADGSHRETTERARASDLPVYEEES